MYQFLLSNDRFTIMKHGLNLPRKRQKKNVFGSDNEEEEQQPSRQTKPFVATTRPPPSVKAAPIAEVFDYDSFYDAKKQKEIQEKKILDADKKKVFAVALRLAHSL